ncbi:MAG: hypothetical protein FD174_3741 [Geobacteraceae bacterium]|nr:MAG: hypothetical protein FD174_3741 [Geobacteraceae bacterium]
MTGNEVMRQIEAQRNANHCCIKWWREEKDFVDFELIDRFIEQVKPDDIVDGFALLDLEQMWKVLTNLDPDKLMRVKKGDGEVIEWVWSDRDGKEKTSIYPFTPEGIMTILNDEFFA